MTRFVILAAVSAACSVALFAEPRSVGVYMSFEGKAGVISVDAMKREAARIMQPTGVALDWRLLEENRGEESFSNLIVLRFRGKCQADAWASSDPEGVDTPATLGWTNVAEGRVLPFGEVECDQVRKSLSYVGAEANYQQKQFALGRALGRVVAHELYHMLAQTTQHASRGLAKASQTWKDLISGAVQLQDRDARIIRERMGGSRAVFSFQAK